jgi:hypothetical protein
MSEFMAQSPIDFFRAVFPKPRIQRNDVAPCIGSPGGAEKAGIPFHVDGASKLFRSEGSQDFPRPGFQGCVAPQHDKSWRSGESEIELLEIRLRLRR